VNSAPSLSTPTNLDEEIKESVLKEGFRLLGLDGSEKAKHLERQQQRLADRRNEHLARREELTRQKEDHLRSSVGFLSSLGQRKLPQISSARQTTQRNAEDTYPTIKAETHESTKGVKSIPGFVSFLEDSEDETETESQQSEEGWTDEDDEQEEDDEVCEEFSFLGTPVSRNYVQILPVSESVEGIWQEIQAGAAKLAQGWTAARPQSQPPRTSVSTPAGKRSSMSRPSLKMVLQGPKKNPLSQPQMLLQRMRSKELREVLPLKTIQIGV